MILYVPNRVGVLFHGFYHDPENFFLFQLFMCVQSEDCKPCTCAWRSQKFQFVPCQVSLAMVAISNKKVLHDMKNRRYFFFEFSPRCRGAYEAPRGEKITHGDPTETEMSNLCAASFEGFWTRFVMDRCRANTFWDYELTRRCHDAFYIRTERGESQNGIIMKMYWKWALSLLMLPWLNTPWLKLVAHTSC